MVLHNPNNWHWVNKDAREWAQKYFDKNLTVLTASSGDTSVKVDKVVSVDGDVDVSQRKGKVITLFDVKMRLEFSGMIATIIYTIPSLPSWPYTYPFSGSTVDDPSVSGTITIPEIAHDTEEDEYVFEVDVYSDTPTKSPIRDLIRSSLIPQLRVALGKFSPDLIAEHGKDIQHAPGTGPSYTPSAPIIPAAASSSSTSVKKTTSSGPIVNTVTLTDSIEFQTSAEQLYSVFVDPGRVTAWSRSTPKVFEPKVGGAFSLFGGNVEGEFKVLEKDAKIVQSWRLGGWPKGELSFPRILAIAVVT
jgi:activator of HSP90 ATPase